MMKVFIARKEVDKCYKVVTPPCPCLNQFIRTAVAEDHIWGCSAGIVAESSREAVQSTGPRTKPR